MKTSNKGLELIKYFEGLHDGDLTEIGLQPKMCPSGIWTEGWGRTMRDEKGKFLRGRENKAKAYANRTIRTIGEADKALIHDIKAFELIVIRKVKIELEQHQFDPLVSHTYNTGGSSTLFNLINTGSDLEKIYKWFTERYVTSEGVKLNGLALRRRAEARMFFNM